MVVADGGTGSGGSSSRHAVGKVVVDGGGGLGGTVVGVSGGSEEADAHLIPTEQQQRPSVWLPLHRRHLK